MPTYTRSWLKNIYTWVHVADADNLVYVHIVVTTDTCKLVSESDVNCTKGVFNHLGHLRSTNIGYYNITLTEACIVLFYLLTNLTRVSTNSAVVVKKLINHVAWDNTLRSVHKVYVLTNLEAVLLDDRTYELVDGSWTDS